jgi:type IV pilus assembly protein PilA
MPIRRGTDTNESEEAHVPRPSIAPAGKIPHARIVSEPDGFTLVELLVVVTVISIVSAIAIPALLRGRITANEAAAIGSVRAINSAESAYAASAAGGNYAPLLSILVLPCPGGTVGFISPDLANDPSQKSGYVLTLSGGAAPAGGTDCNGTPTQSGYYLTAVPRNVGTTGHRGFASSSRSVVFFDPTGAAPTEASMAPGGGGVPIQ